MFWLNKYKDQSNRIIIILVTFTLFKIISFSTVSKIDLCNRFFLSKPLAFVKKKSIEKVVWRIKLFETFFRLYSMAIFAEQK